MANILYLATLVQDYLGQTMNTLFPYFSVTSSNNTSQLALAEHIEDYVLPSFNALQNEAVANVMLRVEATNNPSGNLTYMLTGNGGIESASNLWVPPNVCLSIRWLVDQTQFGPRPTNIVYGMTRVSGLVETGINGGRADTAWFNSIVDTFVANKMDDVSLGGDDFIPVVHVNKQMSGLTWKVAPIIGMNGFKLGTQNTRKLSY